MIDLAKLSFSKEQQQALFGHALLDAAIYAQCLVAGVAPGWFLQEHHQRLWVDLVAFQARHSRHPTEAEFHAHVKDADVRIEERLRLEVTWAIGARTKISVDTLLDQLKEWAASQQLVRFAVKLQDTHNRGDVWQCRSLLADTLLRLDNVASLTGITNRVEMAPVRARAIVGERPGEDNQGLTYGLGFLDDATGGIAPRDLIVIGAKTGVGKTELVKQIAFVNAKAGKRVTLFALEAEDHEIERRIMYQYMAIWFHQNHSQVPFGKINYADWRLGHLPELDVYRKQAGAKVNVELATLATYYRNSGNFGIQEMEQAISRAAETSDLIILDHLHYVDTDGDNENAEMKAVIKKLRDLALVLHKPIIVVAHLRKTFGGKGHSLVPGLEDFHGSSDVIKIATTAIILAPAFETKLSVNEADVMRSWPTYMRLGKLRLDGSRTRYTGVAFFDPHINGYLDQYALGKLTKHETCWEPATPLPAWAKASTVQMNATDS